MWKQAGVRCCYKYGRKEKVVQGKIGRGKRGDCVEKRRKKEVKCEAVRVAGKERKVRNRNVRNDAKNLIFMNFRNKE